MKKDDVIMPSAEDLAEFAEEGYQHQKNRGRLEMAGGIGMFVVGLLVMVGYYDAYDFESEAWVSGKGFAFAFGGVVSFAVGLSRQFRGKQ